MQITCFIAVGLKSFLTLSGINCYIRSKNTETMFRGLRDLYGKYKAYVRVDLVMYLVMILLIVIYAIYTLLVD